jgi:hypothetical protein
MQARDPTASWLRVPHPKCKCNVMRERLAGPPSPLNPVEPLPATVVIFLLTASTRLIWLLPVSAPKRLPHGSEATAVQLFSLAATAALPSPL